jgi:cytochrome bd ubiquinol oxidase subunit I
VVIGTLLAAGVVVFWLLRWRGIDLLNNRWFLRFSMIAGPLAILAVELGWVATEVGRQPWTVWQILRTNDAASTNPGLWWSYLGVLVIYLGMTVGAYVVLRSMAKRWRTGETDLPSPYGPPREETAA